MMILESGLLFWATQ